MSESNNPMFRAANAADPSRQADTPKDPLKRPIETLEEGQENIIDFGPLRKKRIPVGTYFAFDNANFDKLEKLALPVSVGSTKLVQYDIMDRRADQMAGRRARRMIDLKSKRPTTEMQFLNKNQVVSRQKKFLL